MTLEQIHPYLLPRSSRECRRKERFSTLTTLLHTGWASLHNFSNVFGDPWPPAAFSCSSATLHYALVSFMDPTKHFFLEQLRNHQPRSSEQDSVAKIEFVSARPVLTNFRVRGCSLRPSL